MQHPRRHSWQIRYFNRMNRPKRLMGLALIMAALLSALLTGIHSPVAQAQVNTPTPNATIAALNATMEAIRNPQQADLPDEDGEDQDGEADALSTATPPVTPTLTPTATPSPTPEVTADPSFISFDQSRILTDTVFVNQTDLTVLLFAEGLTYEVPSNRAIGIPLPEDLTAVSLYTCPAPAPESDTCFWDPYPVYKDVSYEVRANPTEVEIGVAPPLVLAEMPLPDRESIRMQNRTGQDEQVLYQEQVVDMASSASVSLALNTENGRVGLEDRPLETLFLRRCVIIGDDQACEWLPYEVTGGVYYALTQQRRVTQPGDAETLSTTSRTLLTALAGEPIPPTPTPTPTLTPTPTITPTPEPLGVRCQVQIPSLNVRAGPGTEYLAVGRVRLDDDDGGAVFVTGQNGAGDWLALNPDLEVEGGWISNLPQFIICDSPTDNLAITGVLDGRLAPTPAPVTAAPADEEADAAEEEEEGPEAEGPAEVAPGIPEGRARLIATNSFEADVRFTLSARQHGLPEDAPSEYDLQPGDSVTLLISAGRVQFSASTPFRGGYGGNAEFVIEEGQTRELFLYFTPTEGGDQWLMRYE